MEFDNPVDIIKELRELDVEIANAKTMVEKTALSQRRLELVELKVGMGKKLDSMRERMHEAAELAEKSGVGTGGKGMPTKDD